MRRTATRLALEVTAVALLVACALAALLALRLSSGPVDLAFAEAQLERALQVSSGGLDASFERVELDWDSRRQQALVTASGLSFRDAAGREVASAREAVLDLDAVTLLAGAAEPRAVELRDGTLVVTKTGDTYRVLGFDIELPDRDPPQSLEELRGLADRALASGLDALEGAAKGTALSSLSFDDYAVRIVEGDRTLLAFSDAEGRLDLSGGRVEAFAAGRTIGDGLPPGIALSAAADFPERTVSAQLALAGTGIERAASLFGAEGWAEGEPVDLVLTAKGQHSGVGSLELRLDHGKLALGPAGRRMAVGPGYLEADLSPGAGSVSVSAPTLQTPFGTAPVTLLIPSAYQKDAISAVLQIGAVPELTLPSFAEPLPLQSAVLPVTLSRDFQSLALSEGRLDLEGLTVALDADLALGGALPGGTVFLSAEGARFHEALALWPIADDATVRPLVEERVRAGVLDRIDVELFLESESDDLIDDVALDFVFSGAVARALSDLPLVTAASGAGRFEADVFTLEVDSGEMGGVSASNALLQIDGGAAPSIAFDAVGTGRAEDILSIISDSRLQLQARSGFDPSRFGGRAEGTVTIRRDGPLDGDPSDTVIVAGATLRDGGVEDAFLGEPLSDVNARISLADEVLLVSGTATHRTVPLQFTWRDNFADDSDQTLLSASGAADAATLARFGLPLRASLAGTVPIEVQAVLEAEALQSADIVLDLGPAAIELPEIGWAKPADMPAQATVSFQQRGRVTELSGRLASPNASLRGQAELGAGGRLLAADIPELSVGKAAGLSVSVTRPVPGRLAVSITGESLELPDPLAGAGSVPGTGFGAPLDIDIALGSLRLGELLDVREAEARLVTDWTGVRQASLRGIEAGSRMEATYSDAGEGRRLFALNHGNAGSLLERAAGSDALSGGRLTIAGTLQDGSASEIDILVEDTRLREAPALGQVLSLASLQGLSDTLGGDGILFSRIELPVRADGGTFVVDGGRAAGPAMGLTVNGRVSPSTREISLDGVLVPSYGMNAALGGVPVFGGLFVGRDGEGVISLTYAVRGTLEKAQVSVNPLSAITPGILRRIFENPADLDLPESARGPSQDN